METGSLIKNRGIIFLWRKIDAYSVAVRRARFSLNKTIRFSSMTAESRCRRSLRGKYEKAMGQHQVDSKIVAFSIEGSWYLSMPNLSSSNSSWAPNSILAASLKLARKGPILSLKKNYTSLIRRIEFLSWISILHHQNSCRVCDSLLLRFEVPFSSFAPEKFLKKLSHTLLVMLFKHTD